MIKKKPYRNVKVKTDKDGTKIFTISDYVIYWIFWFIPIYIICKDKVYIFQCEGLKDSEMKDDVYKWMK